MKDPRIQARFKRCRHKKLSYFRISQDFYGVPRRTIRANGIIYNIFKPNEFRDVHNFYQDKVIMIMTLDELKYLKSTCWNERYQLLTIAMTKDKLTAHYRLGFSSLFVPDTSFY